MNTKISLHDQTTFRAVIAFALVILFGMGLLYSLTGTVIGRTVFPQQATGSIVTHDGKAVGSSLIAQPFADARYFQPRPSAAGYDPMAAAGSNQARTNPDLRKRIDETVAAVAAREGIATQDVPGELVTQSGGGLDPDISPAGAQVQIARVAQARVCMRSRLRNWWPRIHRARSSGSWVSRVSMCCNSIWRWMPYADVPYVPRRMLESSKS